MRTTIENLGKIKSEYLAEGSIGPEQALQFLKAGMDAIADGGGLAGEYLTYVLNGDVASASVISEQVAEVQSALAEAEAEYLDWQEEYNSGERVDYVHEDSFPDVLA